MYRQFKSMNNKNNEIFMTASDAYIENYITVMMII